MGGRAQRSCLVDVDLLSMEDADREECTLVAKKFSDEKIAVDLLALEDEEFPEKIPYSGKEIALFSGKAAECGKEIALFDGKAAECGKRDADLRNCILLGRQAPV